MNQQEKWGIITLTLLMFVIGTSEFIVIGLLAEIADDLNVSISVAGLLISVFAISYAIGTPIITAFCSRFEKYPLCLSLMILFIIGNAISACAENFYTLLWSRIFIAVLSGALISLAMVISNEIVKVEKRAATIALVFAGFSVANVIGVPLGTWIGQLSNWRIVFWLNALLGIWVLLLQIKFLPKNLSGQMISLSSQLALLKNSKIIFLILIPTLGAAATFTIYTYISAILTESMGVNSQYISFILLVFGIFAVISNILSSTLAKHNGLRNLMYLFILQAIIYLILFKTIESLWLGLLTLFAMALLFYTMNTTIQLYLMSLSKGDFSDFKDFLASLTPVAINLGIAIGAYLGGLGIQIASFKSLPIISTVLVILAAILSWYMFRKRA